MPRRFESYGGPNSKNHGSLGSKIVSRSVNFTKSPPGKVFINSNKLTAVVVRHKPVATEQYIKSKLQPYADKDKFKFTKGESIGSYSTATDAYRSGTQTKFLQSSFIIQPDPTYTTGNSIVEKKKVRKVKHKRIKKESKE